MGNQFPPYSRDEIETVRHLADDEGMTDAQIERATDGSIPRNRARGIRHKCGIASPFRATGRPRWRKVLPPEELAYLRRQVGWRPDVDYSKVDDDEPAAVWS